MELLILKTISKHIKDKKVIASNEYGFLRGHSCLANLIAFYNEMTGLVDNGRTLNVFSLTLAGFLTLLSTQTTNINGQ